jgi:hypothetical protein
MMSVRMEQRGSHWTDFHKILRMSIFEKSVKEIQVPFTSDKKNGTLYHGQYTFLVISGLILFVWNVLDKRCREKSNRFHVG